MKSLNFAIVGDASIASSLGKFSSKTDITIYDQKTADFILTFYVASSYPGKIQPLIQILAFSDWPILSISKFDKFVGEQIIAIDSFKFELGFIFCTQDLPVENIKKIVQGTSLERFIFVDSLERLKEEIAKIVPREGREKTKIIIDQAFNVKGVGTVVLGSVKDGKIKVHDVLEIFPAQKEVVIKSIQMHDVDVQEAPTGGKVGLSIKGVTADELSSGDVIAAKGSLSVSKDFLISFEKSNFYKGEIKPGGQYYLAVGAKINPVKVETKVSDIRIIAEKPFAFSKKERCILLDLNAQGLRIVGSGNII